MQYQFLSSCYKCPIVGGFTQHPLRRRFLGLIRSGTLCAAIQLSKNCARPDKMSAEIKKEIELEIAHVLFVDIVGYSKLSINEQRTAVDELTKVVRSSDQYQKAEDLEEYEHWRPLLHSLGEYEVKHGVRVAIVNLYADEVGNPQLPKKFQALQKRSARMRWAATTAVLLAVAMIVAGIALFSRYRVRATLAPPEKSIAVLPFENRSEDKANAYFADGIQDEILTRLA